MDSLSIRNKQAIELVSVWVFLILTYLFRWTNYTDDIGYTFIPFVHTAWEFNVLFLLNISIRVVVMAVLMRLYFRYKNSHQRSHGVQLVLCVAAIVSVNLSMGLIFHWTHWWMMAIRDYSIVLFFLFPSVCSSWRALIALIALASLMLALYLVFSVEPSMNPNYIATQTSAEAEQLCNRYYMFCNYVFDVFVICSWAVAHNFPGPRIASGLEWVTMLLFMALCFVMIAFFPFTPFIVIVPVFACICIAMLNKKFSLKSCSHTSR